VARRRDSSRPDGSPAATTAARPHEPAASRSETVLASRYALAGVLVLAGVLRLAHVLAIRRYPLFEHLLIDAAAYDAWARRIAAGDWLGDRIFYQDPLYPYALAALYRLAGRDLLVVRLLQAALGVGTVWLTALLGRRVGGRAVGNVAAAIVAAYGALVFQDAEVEKTVLGVFLFTAALALAFGRSTRSRAAAGAALALAVLTRGNLLALAPLAVAWFVLEPGPGGDAPPGEAAPARGWAAWARRLRGPAGRGALAFSLAFAGVLLPVAWRNHHVAGEWILTTAQAGQNLYIGNNPTNETGAFALVPFVRSDPAYLEADFAAAAEARTGRHMTPSEVSSFWAGEALAHVRANPGFAALVTLKKSLLFLADLEMPDAWDMYFVERLSPALALPLASFGLVFALAVAGVLAGAGGRRARALAVAATVYGATVVAFFVVSRYRLPIVPALAVLAAGGLLAIVERVRRRAWRAAAAPALAAGLAGAVSFGVVRPDEPRENISSYVSLATLYARDGDLASAERLFAEALARYPGDPATLLCGLGRVQLDARRPEAAVASIERCVRSDPAYPEGWYDLGRAREAAGDLPGAVGALERQVVLIPGHVEATLRLAELEVRTGLPQRAVERLGTLLARRAADPRVAVALAVALRAAGRAEEAVGLVRASGGSLQTFAREYTRVTGRPP
jgi:tetratricopeptide (TPR) repeat protein